MSSEATIRDEHPIFILPAGDFGHAVAGDLKGLLPAAVVLREVTHGGVDALQQDHLAIAVLVSGRAMPEISELLDARSHRTKTPFISLMLQDGAMLLGPIVIPGEGCCWRCWASRDLLLDPSPHVKQQRTDYYAQHPNEGPQGYLPSIASLGAAQLAGALEAIQRREATAGQILRRDLYRGTITVGKVIGFDNCDRCGLHRPLRSRSYAGLQAWFSLRDKANQ